MTSPVRTIACLTAPGRSAVAVLRLTGGDVFEQAAHRLRHADGRVFTAEELARGTTRPLFARLTLDFSSDFSHDFSPNNGDAPSGAETVCGDVVGGGDVSNAPLCEEVVLNVIDSTRLEIQTHGGEGVIRRVMELFARLGFEPVDPLAPTPNESFAATAERLLPGALTEQTARILLEQANGAATRFFQRLFDTMDGAALRTSPDSGASRESHDSHDLCDLLSPGAAITRVLSFEKLGKRLTEPFRVVLAGPVNSGKSTLFNALLGFERAITDAAAGTTRDVVSAETAFDSVPVRLFDTAGLRDAGDRIEREGIERAEALFAQADLILALCDSPHTLPQVAAMIQRFAGPDVSVQPVLTKIDLLPDHAADELPGSLSNNVPDDKLGDLPGIAPDFSRRTAPLRLGTPEIWTVSARDRSAVARMERLIADRCVGDWPRCGEPVPLTDAQTAFYQQCVERFQSGIPLSDAEKTAIIKAVSGEFPEDIRP